MNAYPAAQGVIGGTWVPLSQNAFLPGVTGFAP